MVAHSVSSLLRIRRGFWGTGSTAVQCPILVRGRNPEFLRRQRPTTAPIAHKFRRSGQNGRHYVLRDRADNMHTLALKFAHNFACWHRQSRACRNSLNGHAAHYVDVCLTLHKRTKNRRLCCNRNGRHCLRKRRSHVRPCACVITIQRNHGSDRGQLGFKLLRFGLHDLQDCDVHGRISTLRGHLTAIHMKPQRATY